MTRDPQVAMLDLDSQTQLLSRIQFLTRFSSNLIQITGREGSGKTWLAQRYLELWAENCKQALLLCHPAQSDSQHRSIILKQLVSQPVFNDQDPLLQSLEHMLGGSPLKLLLVVDDAHLLSPALIAELWALVQKAQAEPGWQVNVLLFSQCGRLDKYLSQVSHGQGMAPLELEITDLTEQEVQTFVEVMFASEQLDANGRRVLRERALTTAPTPGALMQIDHTEQTNMAGSSSRKLSPMALLVVLLAFVAAGLVFLFFPAAEEPQSAEEASSYPPPVSGEAVLTTGRFDESQPLAAPEPEQALEQQEATRAKIANDDTRPLPPEVSLEGLTVGRSDNNPRVVVPSDVVDAMMTEQALGGSGEQAVTEQMPEVAKPVAEIPLQQDSPLVPDLAPTAVEPAPEAASANPASEAAVQESHSSPAPVTAAVGAVAEVASEPQVLGAELKAINQRHYALQLAALKSMTAANNFIADYKIADIATIYETRRNGEPWFIIVTGDYPDMVSARKAETRMPARLQAVQPWVKSYGQIHREIDRVK